MGEIPYPTIRREMIEKIARWTIMMGILILVYGGIVFSLFQFSALSGCMKYNIPQAIVTFPQGASCVLNYEGRTIVIPLADVPEILGITP